MKENKSENDDFEMKNIEVNLLRVKWIYPDFFSLSVLIAYWMQHSVEINQYPWLNCNTEEMRFSNVGFVRGLTTRYAQMQWFFAITNGISI